MVGTICMKPMISIAGMAGLLEAITAAGKNPDQILHALGLDRSVFVNSDGFVASSIFAQLFEEAGRQTDDDCFGLHFDERFNPKTSTPWSMSSSTRRRF